MVFSELAAKLTRKKKESASNKIIGNPNLLNFDLMYQLSYMSVIASAGIPRNKIFERAANLPCASARYFHKIQMTQSRLQYDYARSCRLVGETAKEEEIKALLLRMSTALISGEPEAAFLAREAETQIESYKNDYYRKLEALKMWSDAYISMILSAVLVIIISIVSTMIWKIQLGFILGMVGISVGATGIGAWLIYLESPRETVVLTKAGSKEQKQVAKLFRLAFPAAIALAAVLAMAKVNTGAILLMVAAIAFPLGLIASKDAKLVSKRDGEIGTFLRSIGGVSTAIGATVKDALGRIDKNAINALRPIVHNLYKRLQAGIRNKLCWERFVEESGSELVGRSSGMFYDAIELGGDPGQAGYRASIFANNIAMLRERRSTVSSPFRWLCIAMHAAVVCLLVFITQVIVMFGNMVANVEKTMPKTSSAASISAFSSFNFSGLETMQSIVMPMILIFTFANAIAPTIAEGGSKYKFMYNLAVTSTISGLAMLILPSLAGVLFSGVKA